jgi:hypothetical protein
LLVVEEELLLTSFIAIYPFARIRLVLLFGAGLIPFLSYSCSVTYIWNKEHGKQNPNMQLQHPHGALESSIWYIIATSRRRIGPHIIPKSIPPKGPKTDTDIVAKHLSHPPKDIRKQHCNEV